MESRLYSICSGYLPTHKTIPFQHSNELATLKEQHDNDLALLENAYDKKLISEETYQEKLKKLKEKYDADTKKADKDSAERINKDAKEKFDALLDAQERANTKAGKLDELSQEERARKWKDYLETLIDDMELNAEQRKEIQEELDKAETDINNLLKSGKSVLCEGAQGTMLDVDFGSYPFVTSSNTICAGACTGLGIGPNKIGDVFGIMKAYCTRVGAGPFPTELFDETGKRIRDLGHEYGAVTGRERRCGWIDLVALKYAIMVNGVTKLIMMKSDVLDGFDTIKACVAYKQNGQQIDYFPYNIEENIEPVYEELPGWKTDMTQFTSEEQFPQAFNDYIKFLEAQLETPIQIISIGPDRAQTIVRK